MSRTFVMVKPDGVERGLVGEIVGRIERKRLCIRAMKMLRIDAKTAEQHYAEHRDKPFFRDLVSFITRGPVVAMVVEGPEAVETVRALMGATDPRRALPGTIPGDFGIEITENLVHGSDGEEAAERELALYFDAEELVGETR